MKDIEQLLAEIQFFAPLGPEQRATVAGCGRTRAFEPDEMLLREGEVEDSFWILRRGSVAIEVFAPNRGSLIVETLGPGDPLGWSWLFPPHRARFDARAREVVTTIEFDGACLRGKCEADHELGYGLLRLFGSVIADRLSHTRLRLLDMYAPVPGG